MNKDIFVKDWGNGYIRLQEDSVPVQMKPTELHHKSDRSIGDGPSFLIVMTRPDIPSKVIGQVSFEMLAAAMQELGYELRAPEQRVWRWWVGTEELPKYVKFNPQNVLGEQKVFRLLECRREAGRVWMTVDDRTVHSNGHVEAEYLLPATFEEYQQFMNAEAV